MTRKPSKTAKGKVEIFWAICHKDFGIYTQLYFTRKAAIADHCAFGDGVTWEEAKARGDRAVKVLVEIIEK